MQFAGTRGISLFIVPKFILTADGGVGERNTVSCGSTEHKMGIRCFSNWWYWNFDNATGYPIGQTNKRFPCNVYFMNTARIGTAVQGIAHAGTLLSALPLCERP